VFSNNKATTSDSYGGAVFILHSQIIMKNNVFTGNTAFNGGALLINNCGLEASCNIFKGNAAVGTPSAITPPAGGAVYSDESAINAAYNRFESNVATEGGAFSLRSTLSTSSFKFNTFMSNVADEGGAISSVFSVLVFNSNTFMSNSSKLGGAILASP
jgi:predicted outer membrane repeat protein